MDQIRAVGLQQVTRKDATTRGSSAITFRWNDFRKISILLTLSLLVCSVNGDDQTPPAPVDQSASTEDLANANDLAALRRAMALEPNSYFLRPIMVLDPYDENPDLSLYGFAAPEEVPKEPESPPELRQDDSERTIEDAEVEESLTEQLEVETENGSSASEQVSSETVVGDDSPAQENEADLPETNAEKDEGTSVEEAGPTSAGPKETQQSESDASKDEATSVEEEADVADPVPEESQQSELDAAEDETTNVGQEADPTDAARQQSEIEESIDETTNPESEADPDISSEESQPSDTGESLDTESENSQQSEGDETIESGNENTLDERNATIEDHADEQLKNATNLSSDDGEPTDSESVGDDELNDFLNRFGAKASAELPNHHHHHTSHCGVWGQKNDAKRADLSVLYLLFRDVVAGDGDTAKDDGKDDNFSSFMRQQLEEHEQERLQSLTTLPETIPEATASATAPGAKDHTEPLASDDNEPMQEEAPFESAKKSPSEDFVEGLDDIDKLFEEVDVPEELDHGTSIQEILNSSGRKIIIKRIAMGLKSAKQWTIHLWQAGVTKVTDKETWQRLGQQTVKTSKKVWSFTNELVDGLLNGETLDDIDDEDYKKEFESIQIPTNNKDENPKPDGKLKVEDEEGIRRWLEETVAGSAR